MNMTDMKMPKKSKKEMEKMSMPTMEAEDQDRWPYGLQIRFEKEQVEKMPSLESYKVGDKIMIQAEACVTSIRISERQSGDEDHTVEMQIEKIACEPFKKKPMEHMTPKEYKAARMEK